jgi:hypothetical protein
LDEWAPDEALVERVRMIGCSIRDLSTEDRAWAVVSLSEMGWTAQDIADRMSCSLRLIRNIKAEPLAAVMEYAVGMRAALLAAQGFARLIETCQARQLAEQAVELARLRRQRGELIEQLTIERALAAVPSPVSGSPRRTTV